MFKTPRHIRRACLFAARANVLQDMAPILERAESMQCVLYNSWQNFYVTVADLKAQWRMARYLWGPACWRLVPRVQVPEGAKFLTLEKKPKKRERVTS